MYINIYIYIYVERERDIYGGGLGWPKECMAQLLLEARLINP